MMSIKTVGALSLIIEIVPGLVRMSAAMAAWTATTAAIALARSGRDGLAR